MGSIARKRVSVLSGGVPSSPRDDELITREELTQYRKALVALLADLVCLFLPQYAARETQAEVAAAVSVTDIQVRSRIRAGAIVPVDVTVCNKAKRQESVELTLADTTENIIIGRQTLYLPGEASRVAHFEWKTTGFRLGDHILEARTVAAGC